MKRLHYSFLPLLSLLLLLWAAQTVYFFFIKDTHENYSLTQSWKEYYSLEDWNLSQHAMIDIDGDGEKDILTFNNCVFLSSLPESKIPKPAQCEDSPAGLVFTDRTLGQKLEPAKPFAYQFPRKSYLVKTQQDVWKMYDINGFQMRAYKLAEDKIFYETDLSLLDKVDNLTYTLSNLGVSLFLIATAPRR